MKYLGTAIIIVLVFVVAIIYSALSKARNKIKEEYSNMNTNLRKRWDLIPSLVNVVRDYSIYEESTLEKFSILKSQVFDNLKVEQKIYIDQNISKVISKMMSMAEKHPDLQADIEYIKLSEQLVELEEEIINIHKEYDKAVNEYNKNIEKFPINIVAILFGFNEESLLEKANDKQQDVEMNL